MNPDSSELVTRIRAALTLALPRLHEALVPYVAAYLVSEEMPRLELKDGDARLRSYPDEPSESVSFLLFYLTTDSADGSSVFKRASISAISHRVALLETFLTNES